MAKVLIVDDDGDSLRLLQAWLTRGGFEVTAAGNGAEALEAAQKNPPDLVVSDILMPVMDGFDLCRKWKADERLRHIPFVFYSANYTKPEDVRFGLDVGADRFIVKPQRREDLLRTLSDVLKKAKPSGSEKAGPLIEGDEFDRRHKEALSRKIQEILLEGTKQFPEIRELGLGLTKRFSELAATEIGGEIPPALRRISEHLDMDRCTFWELSEDATEMNPRYHYTAPGYADDSMTLTKKTSPWLFEKGLNKPYLNFARLEDLPPEAAADKSTLEKKGMKSALLFPYHIGGRTIAGMTFDSMKEERTFSEDFISLAKLLGEIIAGAFYRMRMEERYEEMRKKLAEASTDAGIGEFPLRAETEDEFAYADIVGRCTAMKFIYSRMEQIAPTDSAVLILGETGTGKGVIARTIHDLSLRQKKRMIVVNCAALPQNLIESELFGREKGAFTGSDSRQIGRFELADQGSLMLDEIADLPLELQAKLLRVIQDGEFERLGSSETLKVDVRIFAVTSKDLKKEVAERRFRQDLYYRLNVFPIVMPPLRERKEDIPLLAEHFLKKFSHKMQKDVRSIPQGIIEDLVSYSWPGNVRELEHVIERAVIVTTGTRLRLAEKLVESGVDGVEEPFITNMAEMEKRHILKVLEKTDWRIEGPKGAAILLGLHPNTLRGRMQKLGIRLRKTAS